MMHILILLFFPGWIYASDFSGVFSAMYAAFGLLFAIPYALFSLTLVSLKKFKTERQIRINTKLVLIYSVLGVLLTLVDYPRVGGDRHIWGLFILGYIVYGSFFNWLPKWSYRKFHHMKYFQMV